MTQSVPERKLQTGKSTEKKLPGLNHVPWAILKILSTLLSLIYFTLRNTRCPSQEGNVSLMKNYSKWDSG